MIPALLAILLCATAPDAGGRGGPALKAPPLWKEWPNGLSLPRDFAPPTSLAPLVRAVSPGVVNISAFAEASAEGAKPAGTGGQSLGSGFLLGPNGYVVTNDHVIDRATQIRVRLADGREFLAEVVGKDASTDLALLRLVGAPPRDLPFVYLGDSDKLAVGDWVVAIGNPFGFDHSVSHGMISAKERVLGVGTFDDFIQTDVLMNPGNSGGPLFNMRGEVVGVNTAIISHAQGIGFAVPINMVKDLLPNLKVNGHLARGWLGLTVAEAPLPSDPTRKVAVVQEVYDAGPATKAGLHEGDRIVAVNGHPIESYLQLLRKVALLAPGSTMRLSVQRGGGARELTVEVAERPAQETVSSLSGYGNIERWGLVLQDLDTKLASTLHVAPYHGVLVAGVVPGGAASQAGLREGDLIAQVNHHLVEDIHALRVFFDREPGHRPLTLKVQRAQESRTVMLSP